MTSVYAFLRSPEDAPVLTWKTSGGWVMGDRAPNTGPKGRNICVVVPGQDVLALKANVPGRNEAEAMRTAAFAVEEEIGQPVEETHVALGPKTDSGVREIRIVSDHQMQIWIARLSAFGWADAQLIAQHDCLPEGEMLVQAGGHVLGRIGDRQFALDETVGADVISGLVGQNSSVAVYGDTLARRLGAQPSGALADGDAVFANLAEWADSAEPVGLRQGKYAVRRAVNVKGLRQWRLAGGLAAAAAFGWLGMAALERSAMAAQTSALNKHASELATAGWPQSNGNIDQALREAREKRAGGGGQVSALTIISILYDAIEQVEGSQIRNMRFDRARSQMTAEIGFNGFDDPDQLTALLNAAGLRARAQGANDRGGRIVASLIVEAGR